MKQALSDIQKAALNLILPLYCQGCEKPLKYNNSLHVCPQCLKKLARPDEYHCALKAKDHNIIDIYHCCSYEGLIKELIHKFKYKKKMFLNQVFVSLMHQLFTDKLSSCKIDFISFVPMHPADKRARGFNQSALLAKNLSEKTGIVLADSLVKSRKTPAQAGLSKESRLSNLPNIFVLNKRINPQGKRVLIIDDVLTTGATMRECASTLYARGAQFVVGLTIAKGI